MTRKYIAKGLQSLQNIASTEKCHTMLLSKSLSKFIFKNTSIFHSSWPVGGQTKMNIIIILLDVHSMSSQGFSHYILYSSWWNKAISISSLKTCNYHWLTLQCFSSEREDTVNIYISEIQTFQDHVCSKGCDFSVGPFPYFNSY